MWNVAGFEMAGYHLDMYPGDHFPHHFHVSCKDFDIRILYRRCNADGVVHYTEVWWTNTRKNWKPLSDREERTLLGLIALYIDQLESEWARMHQ